MANRFTRKHKLIAIATGICIFALAIKSVKAAILVSTLVAYSSGSAISTTETSWTASDQDISRNITLQPNQEVVSGGSAERLINLGESGYSQTVTQDDSAHIEHLAVSDYQSEGPSIHQSETFLQADGSPLELNFCDASQLAMIRGEAQSEIPYSEDAISREIAITNSLKFSGTRQVSQIDQTPDTLTHNYAQTGDGIWTDWIRTTSLIGQGNQTDLILKQNHYEHNVRIGSFDVNRSFSLNSFKTAFAEVT